MGEMGDKNGQRGPFHALGRHLTLEYYDCGPEALIDQDQVEAALLNAARQSGATVISSSFHRFDPQGISGVVIIAESHFTVHGWPEHNYAAVDIFTCGDAIDLDLAIQSMQKSFGAGQVVISSDRNRGVFPESAQEKTPGPLEGQSRRAILPTSWQASWQTASPQGLALALDLFCCDPGMLSDLSQIPGFVRALCRKLELDQDGGCEVVPLGENSFAFGVCLENPNGGLRGSGHVSQTCAYLDFFFTRFFEPRQVAEFALAHFKAGHYKLKISLRQ